MIGCYNARLQCWYCLDEALNTSAALVDTSPAPNIVVSGFCCIEIELIEENVAKITSGPLDIER